MFFQLKSLVSSRIRLPINMRRTSTHSSYGGLTKQEYYILAEKLAPFIHNFLQPKINHVERGKLVLKLPFKPDFVGNPAIPCLHGGITAAIIDHCGGFCAWTVLANNTKLLNTVDLRIDYLRPAPCEDLICEATVINDKISANSKLIRADIVVWNHNQTIKLAVGRGVYNVYTAHFDLPAKLQEVAHLYPDTV